MALIARSFKVTAADFSRWHEAFFDRAEYALKEKKPGSEDKNIGQL